MIYIGVDPGCPLTVACWTPPAKGLENNGALTIFDGEMLAQHVRTRKSKKTGKWGMRWDNDPVLLVSALDGIICPIMAKPEVVPYEACAAIERAATRPDQGAASQARYIASEGIAWGVLASMYVPVTRATPSQWKRQMGLSADKERSRQVAIAEFPHHAGLFTRKMDHNRAEAALLALWLKRKMEGA